MGSISRVLITGGTGFVAHWMARTEPKGLSVFYVNHNNYEDAMTYLDMDTIVHLAPISPARVLVYAQKHNTRVLYASSGAVYDGKTEYADNKRKWEKECQDSGVDVIIARLFAFIGEHLKNLYAVTQFIEAAKTGKPLEVWGDGSTVRSYLYGEDLGRWMWKLLLEGEGVYDVGSIAPVTTLELARMVADVIPGKIHVLNNRYPATRYLPYSFRAQDELGCKETIGLKEAIERVIHDRS